MRELILSWLARDSMTSEEIEKDIATLVRAKLFTAEPGDDVRKCLFALMREDLIELLPTGGAWKRKPVRAVEPVVERQGSLFG